MTLRNFILPFSLAFMLAACLPTRHPLGIDDEDWQIMSLQQRLDAQEKQAELEHADRVRKAEQKAAPEAEASRQPVQPAPAETRRAPAAPVRYGERLQCVLSQTKVRVADKWRPVESTVLDVSRGQVTEFSLAEPTGEKGRGRIQLVGFARFDGQRLTLCPSADENRRDGCARVLGTFEDFRRGIDKPVEAAGFLRTTLHCHLGPGAGMSAQLISAKSGDK